MREGWGVGEEGRLARVMEAIAKERVGQAGGSR